MGNRGAWSKWWYPLIAFFSLGSVVINWAISTSLESSVAFDGNEASTPKLTLLERVEISPPKVQRDPKVDSVARVWESFSNHTWCHSRPGRDGLLYIKISKTGSSTNSGIAIRVAKSLGERKWGKKHRECRHSFRHGRHQQSQPRRRPGILWTFLRDPLSRGLSDYFHFEVSRRGVEPTAESLVATMHELKGFQLLYAAGYSTRTLWDDVAWLGSPLSFIEERVMNKYDFIGLVERRWESLALMKILWGLETSDLIVLSSKHSGGYDDGKYENRCVKIQKPPKFSGFNPIIQDYLHNEFPRFNYDYTLYDIANRSLDLTIDAVGHDLVESESRLLRATQAYADDACQDAAIFPCSADGEKQFKLAAQSCYYNDFGCGHACTDQLLHEGYRVPDEYFT